VLPAFNYLCFKDNNRSFLWGSLFLVWSIRNPGKWGINSFPKKMFHQVVIFDCQSRKFPVVTHINIFYNIKLNRNQLECLPLATIFSLVSYFRMGLCSNPVRWALWIDLLCSCITHKYSTRLKVYSRVKRSGLLWMSLCSIDRRLSKSWGFALRC
jgi:hypothetical protein